MRPARRLTIVRLVGLRSFSGAPFATNRLVNKELAMQVAAVLLALAALGGTTIVGMRLTGTPRPPTWMPIGHGVIAASGVASLIYAAATETVPTLALVSIGVFVLAA